MTNISIYNAVERSYPLADDAMKSRVYVRHGILKEIAKDLTDSDLPIVATAYDEAVKDCERSHRDNLDRIVSIGFEVERRAA